jgi:hypothetical protein
MQMIRKSRYFSADVPDELQVAYRIPNRLVRKHQWQNESLVADKVMAWSLHSVAEPYRKLPKSKSQSVR